LKIGHSILKLQFLLGHLVVYAFTVYRILQR